MTIQYSTVKWFDAKKGYGFINHPDGGNDIFIHYSQIESEDDFKTLRTGQSVQFEMNDGPKGIHAVNVQALDDGQVDSAGQSGEPSHAQTASTNPSAAEPTPPDSASTDASPVDPAPAPTRVTPGYNESEYGDTEYEDTSNGVDYEESDYGDSGYDEGDLV